MTDEKKQAEFRLAVINRASEIDDQLCEILQPDEWPDSLLECNAAQVALVAILARTIAIIAIFAGVEPDRQFENVMMDLREWTGRTLADLKSGQH